jgi:hypothetical protein
MCNFAATFENGQKRADIRRLADKVQPIGFSDHW